MVKWVKKISEKKDIRTAATGSVLQTVEAPLSSTVQSNLYDEQANGMELLVLPTDTTDKKDTKYCNICRPESHKKDRESTSVKNIIDTKCKYLDPNSKYVQVPSGIINPCDSQVSVIYNNISII